MTNVVCVEEPIGMIADFYLLFAVAAGYLTCNIAMKRFKARTTEQRQPTPTKDADADAPLDCTALPVEVQARVARLSGIQSWSSLAQASSMHQYALFENGAVWANLAGEPIDKEDFRRRSLGLESLATMSLLCAADVDKAASMLHGARPSDEVAQGFVDLVTRTAASSSGLFWRGVGVAGVSMESIAKAVEARANLFAPEQLSAILARVEEHEETLGLLEMPDYPDVDFSAQIAADVDQQLRMQYDSVKHAEKC
jgi:hypothetical protein